MLLNLPLVLSDFIINQNTNNLTFANTLRVGMMLNISVNTETGVWYSSIDVVQSFIITHRGDVFVVVFYFQDHTIRLSHEFFFALHSATSAAIQPIRSCIY